MTNLAHGHHELECVAAIEQHLARGLSSFGIPEPLRLDEWAEGHFYLSAESSYVEQRWQAWPFQRAILACIGNDDIREVDFMKSARVGYTKMILAAVGYFAEHKRRNQALWQPTDDDRDEFVKTELDPMLRDVSVMQSVFPAYLSRHKDNTLQQKKFLGSMLHLRGGKAAKNYRRISVDTAYLDEMDAFDSDVEKEGDPHTLASKRVEGATFPKIIAGTTPKLKGFSLIESRVQQAEGLFDYCIPCPHCGEHHPLTWGGKDESHGFKWDRETNAPDGVRHLCPHCGTLITQGEFLSVWESGIWRDAVGTTIDHAGVFRDSTGQIIAPYRHVAFHIWTAYSPAVAWAEIVREFQAAYTKAQEGDNSKLKAFWNTTLGRTWEGDIEKTDADEIRHRAEPFSLSIAPRGCLLLLASVDTQDNRLECAVWGYGRGCEKWTIAHQVFFGNPVEDAVWQELEDYLFETRFRHVSGSELQVYATAIDSGGHHTHAVYDFCRKHARRKVFAVKGRSGAEKHIKDGAGQVDIDWRGRRTKRGIILWQVGTNHAKDLIHSRLQITRPGPGYIHFSNELSDEWFRQFAGEVRATRDTARGNQSRWTPIRKRVEALDCATYVVWLETHLELSRKSQKYWDDLEAVVQPANGDLFAQQNNDNAGHEPVVVTKKTREQPPVSQTATPARRRTSNAFASSDWLERM